MKSLMAYNFVKFVILSLVLPEASAGRSWDLGPDKTKIVLDAHDSLLTSQRITDDAARDQIQYLPGLEADFESLPFKQFSGYLEVDASAGRHLFYWFVEAENNPETAPVMLWTNGGPGCSGFIGFLTEQGPFRPTKKGERLLLNQYNWNKVANIFFIEQPAGVGFSYSEDKSDYTNVGDAKAAEDNYRAIVQFFKRFPQYKENRFYISSESYGGHYIPTLAKRLVEGNEVASPEEHVNFIGFLVGNPYTNPDENVIGNIGALWGHQLVPKPLADRWFKECIIQTHICPNWATHCKSESRHIQDPVALRACVDLEEQIKTSAGKLNPYALDFPTCNHPLWPQSGLSTLNSNDNLNNRGKVTGHGTAHANLAARSAPEHASLAQSWTLRRAIEKARGGGGGDSGRGGGVEEENNEELSSGANFANQTFVPCVESYATAYLNRKDVQEAIHVLPKAIEGRNWSECTNGYHIHYNDTDMTVDTSVYYKFLIDGGYGLDILIYSGDADSNCGTQGTQTWIYDLKYKVISDWKEWLFNEQVAGYMTKFDGFKFLTVRNAGHEVPTYQPKLALEMLKLYLNNSF